MSEKKEFITREEQAYIGHRADALPAFADELPLCESGEVMSNENAEKIVELLEKLSDKVGRSNECLEYIKEWCKWNYDCATFT